MRPAQVAPSVLLAGASDCRVAGKHSAHPQRGTALWVGLAVVAAVGAAVSELDSAPRVGLAVGEKVSVLMVVALVGIMVVALVGITVVACVGDGVGAGLMTTRGLVQASGSQSLQIA